MRSVFESLLLRHGGAFGETVQHLSQPGVQSSEVLLGSVDRRRKARHKGLP
ncbi:hypothetical protein AB0395_41260 [Streptosporangium sp. NPDC051023]|uniref:hypothetical protein n=1 Tax=Streptosporangium sp. NPDC051023 TaxID=3155410 RepID=UPI00344D6F63